MKLKLTAKFMAFVTARKSAVMALFAFVCGGVFAVDPNAGFSDGIDRNDPKFVKVSLLVINPGNELFSCVGHAVLRLECPTFKLDNCFSYESEDVPDRLPRMLAGSLKMGMVSALTDEYLAQYRKDGRGVRQYTLNLPPKAKQRLWAHMDGLRTEGMTLAYDYVNRGCAKAILDWLDAAFAPNSIKGRMQKITGREMFLMERNHTHPWNMFFLDAICGTEGDVIMEVITPRSLLKYLRTVEVNGVPILLDDGCDLTPQTLKYGDFPLTPFALAWVVLAVVILSSVVSFTAESGAGLMRLARGVAWVLLVIQALGGAFFVYMVAATHLPGYGWNWHVVPFNPVMPVLAAVGCVTHVPRKVYRGVMFCCAFVLFGWVACMLLAPHTLVESTYLVLAAGYGVLYVGLPSVCKRK